MEDIEKQVIDWHLATFPNATGDAIISKLFEEINEFANEIYSTEEIDPFTPRAIEEFADVCIVFMAGLARFNYPHLTEYISKKMETNKKRKWGKETRNGGRPRKK